MQFGADALRTHMLGECRCSGPYACEISCMFSFKGKGRIKPYKKTQDEEVKQVIQVLRKSLFVICIRIG